MECAVLPPKEANRCLSTVLVCSEGTLTILSDGRDECLSTASKDQKKTLMLSDGVGVVRVPFLPATSGPGARPRTVCSNHAVTS